ncbi:hypothetical protein KB976_004366 [Vibrio parahaemolyticus]|uniref:hypothetical protein n=1 Tax=Vibrio owensii TaxID=696485 RepID=UPI0022DE46E3|nr:hypothetical protein [Vibrio owensii]EHJ9985229.1 hypothetical protein [Vibrio parahaemolyticus]MDA0385597.1 hypothetical protein [Vibrio owensii]
MTTHVAFVSSKGGTNKSTLCKCFHKTLRQYDVNVWGDDNDPQQHFMNYLNNHAIEPHNKDVMIYDTLGAWTSVNRDFLNAIKEHEHIIIVPLSDGEDEVTEAIKMLKRINELEGQFNVYVLYSSLHHSAKRPNDNDLAFRELGAKTLNTFIPRMNKYKNQKLLKDKNISRVLEEVGLL